MRNIRANLFVAVATLALTSAACKTSAPVEAQLKDENLETENATFSYQTPEISPAFNTGPVVFDGPYDLNPEIVAERYRPFNEDGERTGRAVDVDRFGTFALCTAPVAKPALIRDLHYNVGNDQYGLRMIPIVDREGGPWIEDEDGGLTYDSEGPFFNYPPEPVTIEGGKTVVGSEEVDKFIRKTFGWDENDENAPIFAPTVFSHPEEHRMTLVGMMKKSLKTENGHTHMGAYIGKGQTRNSPYLYHDQKWKIAAYPTNISSITMDGVDPWDLNMNFLVALDVLNEFNDGPVFPPDYKFDHFKGINLEETLAFYRAWIDPEWVRSEEHGRPFLQVIREDESFFTYCAEHITMVINVGLNVPHSLAGFKAVWPRDEQPANGVPDGEDLWNKLNERYTESFGIAVPEVTNFEPLWKKNGVLDPTREATFAKGLAWPPQTTADLMANFTHNYLNFTKINPVISTGVLLGMMETILKRMHIKPEEYLEQLIQPTVLMFKHHLTRSNYGRMTGSTKLRAKLVWLRGELFSLIQAVEIAWGRQIGNPPNGWESFGKIVMAKLNEPAMKEWILENDNTEDQQAFINFREEVKGALVAARRVQAGTGLTRDERGETKTVMYYSPPGVLHRIVSGMHPVDNHVNIRTLATVFDASELTYRGDRRRVIADPSDGLSRCGSVSFGDFTDFLSGTMSRIRGENGEDPEESTEEGS